MNSREQNPIGTGGAEGRRGLNFQEIKIKR